MTDFPTIQEHAIFTTYYHTPREMAASVQFVSFLVKFLRFLSNTEPFLEPVSSEIIPPGAMKTGGGADKMMHNRFK